MVPGEQSVELLPGRHLILETKKKGILEGPVDVTELETVISAEQLDKDGKQLEEKKIISKE